MKKQQLGTYFTYAGYAAGLVTLILAAHHLPILIMGSAAAGLLVVGRRLETFV